MHSIRKFYLPLLSSAFLCCSLYGTESLPAGKSESLPKESVKNVKIDESFRQEGSAAVRRGVEYLLSRQLPDGSWGSASRGRAVGNPAITALAGMAIYGSGNAVAEAVRTKAVEQARSFVLKHVQKDGSIYLATGASGEYPTYTTAIALTFLASLRNPQDEQVIRAARKFLIGLQLDEDNPILPTQKEDPKYGGFGYGPDKDGMSHADLSNTAWVAEALHASEYITKEPYAASQSEAKEGDLAWDKLAVFLTGMQNAPETNHAVWVIADQSDDACGGFVYQVESAPEDAAGEKADDKTARKPTLRTYGSMTYAGLKSMIYAKLKPDDSRVKAAVEWSARHYTLNENPGVGAAGLYYYIQTFAKTHDVLNEETVKSSDGKSHKWREDVIAKLLSDQKGGGEWLNDNGRWMESSSELVTTYSLLSMELALGPALQTKKP